MNTKVILLDADVFIHFMKADAHQLLPQIFPSYDLCVLDVVYEELSRRKNTKFCVDELLGQESIVLIEFPSSNTNILIEYARLQNDGKGIGESACMAVARYRKNIIAVQIYETSENTAKGLKLLILQQWTFWPKPGIIIFSQRKNAINLFILRKLKEANYLFVKSVITSTNLHFKAGIQVISVDIIMSKES